METLQLMSFIIVKGKCRAMAEGTGRARTRPSSENVPRRRSPWEVCMNNERVKVQLLRGECVQGQASPGVPSRLVHRLACVKGNIPFWTFMSVNGENLCFGKSCICTSSFILKIMGIIACTDDMSKM